MKIVFCDVDGVLNNPSCYAGRTVNGTPADPQMHRRAEPNCGDDRGANCAELNMAA